VGIEARCAAVTFECDGLPCEVSLGIDSGSVTGLSLAIPAPGFPAIDLRRETQDQVEGKRKGITREVQTGDAAFDAFVYVASDHADDDVLPVLSAPAVRDAIVRLLDEAEVVSLGGAYATAHVPKGVDGAFDPDRIRDRVAALRVVAGAPRPVAPRRASKDVWGVAAAGAALFAFTVGPPLIVAVWTRFRPVAAQPMLVGLGVGLLAALAAQPILTRVLRGRWDSHQSLPGGRLASVLLLPELAIIALLAGNALFDRSAEQRRELVVESVKYDADDGDTTAFARGDGEAAALGALEIVFHDPTKSVAAGQRVTIGIRGGALGWAWRSSAGRVEVTGGVLVEK
jgi:hypothetical protein